MLAHIGTRQTVLALPFRRLFRIPGVMGMRMREKKRCMQQAPLSTRGTALPNPDGRFSCTLLLVL